MEERSPAQFLDGMANSRVDGGDPDEEEGGRFRGFEETVGK